MQPQVGLHIDDMRHLLHQIPIRRLSHSSQGLQEGLSLQTDDLVRTWLYQLLKECH